MKVTGSELSMCTLLNLMILYDHSQMKALGQRSRSDNENNIVWYNVLIFFKMITTTILSMSRSNEVTGSDVNAG